MLQIQFDFQCLLLVVASGMINSLKAQPIYNSKLSSRELDVLSYLSRGKTAKEIGMQLAISRRTVEHHIENIKIKTNCNSKAELISMYWGEL